MYKVRIFCAAAQEPQPKVATSHQCYGVYYAIDPETGAAFVRIPPSGDQAFPDNTREALVRPQIDAGLKTDQHDSVYYQQPYVPAAPTHTAVSAKPLVTPKK